MEKPDLFQLDSWFKVAEDAQTTWKTQAQDDLNFAIGNQWDSKDLEILDQQKRPHLTFNHILPRLNLIMGYHIQNRTDIKVYNKKGGSQEVAEILTAIIKHIHDNSNGNFEVSLAFLYGLISAKAYLGVTVDYDYDVYNGELKIENIPAFQVYPDPYFERYDFSDASYLFRTIWLPKHKIELLFPEKKEELSNIQIDDRDRLMISKNDSSSYKANPSAQGSEVSDKDKYKYRVKQCWWKEYSTENFLFDLEKGTARRTDLKNEEIKQVLAQFRQLRKIKRVIPIMHSTIYVGNTELENIIPYEDKGGLRRFPIVPFYSYWIDNNFFGFVTNLKDPQREVNKRYSQLLHHLNTSANSGWIGDPMAVEDWDELEEMGSRAGVSIKLKPGKKYGVDIERITPAPLSEGHLLLAKEGATQMNLVSGVDPTLFGVLPDQRESGIAIQVRQKQSITGLESIFDNFRTTKQLLGKVLIELIQKSGCYSKEEILRIVVDGEEKEYQINQPSFIKRMLGVGKVMNDVTIGEYDCTISESPSNPTVRMTRFLAMVEAVKAGIPYPPESLIKASDFPDKEEALEYLKKTQESQAAAAKTETDLKMKELQLKDKELNIKGQSEMLKAGLKEKEIEGKGGEKETKPS